MMLLAGDMLRYVHSRYCKMRHSDKEKKKKKKRNEKEKKRRK
jgi:hypothetical protein